MFAFGNLCHDFFIRMANLSMSVLDTKVAFKNRINILNHILTFFVSFQIFEALTIPDGRVFKH